MFSVPLAQLSHENGESLTKKDLSEGADVLMEHTDGKTYDVRICEVVLSSPQRLPTIIIKIDHNYTSGKKFSIKNLSDLGL